MQEQDGWTSSMDHSGLLQPGSLGDGFSCDQAACPWEPGRGREMRGWFVAPAVNTGPYHLGPV